MIFIGGINKGNLPQGGEEAKNQIFINYLQSKYKGLIILDTHSWRERKFKVIKQLIWCLFLNSDKTIILSVANTGAGNLLKILNKFNPLRKNIYFFVIGGTLNFDIHNGRFSKEIFKEVKHFFVESKQMEDSFKELGFDNVIHTPNFKPVIPLSFLTEKNSTPIDNTKFVFLSRINNDKGVTLIFEVASRLKKEGYNFIIDFYGFIDDDYKIKFDNLLLTMDNLNYRGFLDLKSESGFIELSKYDYMLFPTYHQGEGFPGVLIDSFISGVPPIVSDWRYNSEIVENNVNGFIVKSKDSQDLYKIMNEILSGKINNYNELSENAIIKAKSYDVNFVLDNAFKYIK